MAGVHQRLNGLELPDFHGHGGGHHDAVTPSRVFHAGNPVFHVFPCFFLGQEPADGFCGILKCLVLRVHLHLGQDRGYLYIHVPLIQLILDGILQVDADIPLAHGHTGRQRRFLVILIAAGQLVHGILDHAHLGAVAVGDNQVHALLHQVNNHLSCLCHCLLLLFDILAQGVTAQGNYYSFFIHNPISLTS